MRTATLAVFLLASATAWAGAKQPQILTVRALSANVVAEPDFLSETVQVVRRNARLTKEGSQGRWFKVRVEKGQKAGWINQSAVLEKSVTLSEKLGGEGGSVTADEVELAGRGFSPEVEGAYRKDNQALEGSFKEVDAIQALSADPGKVGAFAKAGKGGGK